VKEPADAGAAHSISWLQQIACTDRFQHFKPTISTQSYSNSGLAMADPAHVMLGHPGTHRGKVMHLTGALGAHFRDAAKSA
jgi:hypothetical protein